MQTSSRSNIRNVAALIAALCTTITANVTGTVPALFLAANAVGGACTVAATRAVAASVLAWTLGRSQLEYVTLLGADQKILKSLNRPRIGELFNPEVCRLTLVVDASSPPNYGWCRDVQKRASSLRLIPVSVIGAANHTCCLWAKAHQCGGAHAHVMMH